MPPFPLRRRHPVASGARLGPLVVLAAMALVACSSGGAANDDPVPTLLTTPLPTSSSTTSTVTPTTSDAPDPTVTTSSSSPSTSTTSTTATTVAAAASTDTPDATGTVPTSPTAGPGGASTSTAAATTTTVDIEPPPTTPPPTAPVPTAAEPPDTIGGRDEDYLLTPRSIAGLQFGASATTVLQRLTDLLGDPLSVRGLGDCPGGPATAFQWFNAGVVVSDQGLAYYVVVMDLDTYGVSPMPFWHTTAGVSVGADLAAVELAYPGQVTYEPPAGASIDFTIDAGPDAGLEGSLFNGVLQSITAGDASC